MSQPSAHSSVSNAMQAAAARDYEAGQTLIELERRQDEVLTQLEDLDQKLTSILRGLGVTLVEDDDLQQPSIRLADLDSDDRHESNENDSRELDSDEDSTEATKELVRPLRRFAA